jgi:hypothetical protein
MEVVVEEVQVVSSTGSASGSGASTRDGSPQVAAAAAATTGSGSGRIGLSGLSVAGPASAATQLPQHGRAGLAAQAVAPAGAGHGSCSSSSSSRRGQREDGDAASGASGFATPSASGCEASPGGRGSACGSAIDSAYDSGTAAGCHDAESGEGSTVWSPRFGVGATGGSGSVHRAIAATMVGFSSLSLSIAASAAAAAAATARARAEGFTSCDDSLDDADTCGSGAVAGNVWGAADNVSGGLCGLGSSGATGQPLPVTHVISGTSLGFATSDRCAVSPELSVQPGASEAGGGAASARSAAFSSPLHALASPMKGRPKTPYTGLKALGGIGALQWSAEDDALLSSAVAELGEADWSKVAACIPKRTAQQCMSRWLKALKKGWWCKAR